MRLFGRQCSLLVRSGPKPTVTTGAGVRTTNITGQEIEVKGLRVQFRVEKTLKMQPNNATISVYNLSAATRAKFQGYFVHVLLQAGYEDQGLAKIFQGSARTVDQVRDGPDWITKIEAGDGEVNFLNCHLSESYRPGTPVSEVLKKLINCLASGDETLDVTDALKQASILDGAPFTSFIHGYAIHGKAGHELEKLLASLGWTASLQDGKLQILKSELAAPGRIPVISPTSGLVGSPEHGSVDKKGKAGKLRVKCLLLPTLRCGGQVEIDSESQGTGKIFRIERLVHTGDTHKQEWYTELELQPDTRVVPV